MTPYNTLRKKYLPHPIRLLLIAESPPPDAATPSSRHFYRTDQIRADDRLFINTVRALYPETLAWSVQDIEVAKESLLRRFQADGGYMIEALDTSLVHEVTKQQRQQLIRDHRPTLIAKISALATDDTQIILIKSNVFDIAAEPLKQAGFHVLNTELVDYPGRFNQRAYREKLQHLTHWFVR